MESQFLELVKLARELSEQKFESKQEWFQSVIEPMWELFQRVHNEQKQVFLRYTGEFPFSITDIDSLIDRVSEDSIRAEDTRLELDSIVSMLDRSNPDRIRDSVIDFIGSLSKYFVPLSPSNLGAYKQRNDIRVLSYMTSERGDFSMHNKPFQSYVGNDSRSVGKLFFIESYEPKLVNRVRFAAILRLTKHKSELNVKELDDFFQIIVNALEQQYHSVSRIYSNIRQEFLSGV